MSQYSFTLVIEGEVEDNLDRLYEAGCDDATFGSVDGIGYADFDRAAASFPDAVTSAIKNIESIQGLRIRRIEPDDFVTASEIANRLNRSRESVRLFINGKRGARDFPAPISHLRSRSRLWRWSDVAAWTGDEFGSPTDAQFIAALNAMLELRELNPRVRELAESVLT